MVNATLLPSHDGGNPPPTKHHPITSNTFNLTRHGTVVAIVFCVATVAVSLQVAFVYEISDDLLVQSPRGMRKLAIGDNATTRTEHTAYPTVALVEQPFQKYGPETPTPSFNSDAPTQQPTQPPFSTLPPKDRVITLVHVGKAGGVSLRRTTTIECQALSPGNATKIEQCKKKRIPQNATLSWAVQHYFHMWSFNKTELERSTSFLVLLRNPVDRVISAFRYSHPLNCNQEKYHKYGAIRPWGCEELKRWKEPDTLDYKMYTECYPSAAMEGFAQNILSPFPPSRYDKNTKNINLTPTPPATDQSLASQGAAPTKECQLLGRNFVQGRFNPFRVAPHMHYNYEYYGKKTLVEHPDKEVFGVRMDHQVEDIRHLDVIIGGVGNVFWNKHKKKKESHGSESYVPSPLSNEAYQKLCCVLEREIGVYEDLVNSVMNFNDTVKQELVEDVKTNCGIQTSWTAWRRNCQDHLEADLRLLQVS